MLNDADKCAIWLEHVTLTCPGIPEMTTIAERVGTTDADWQRLRMYSAQWVDSLLEALSEFMSGQDLQRLVIRLNEFLYDEAMRAGLDLHRNTGALLNHAPETTTAWSAASAAMAAGALRTAFEGVHYAGRAYVDENEPAIPEAAVDAARSFDR